MKKLALFILSAVAALAANVQVRNLSLTTVLPASNDYLLVDGNTNTTTKNLLMNLTFQTATRTTLAGLSVTNVATGVVVQTQGGATVADGNASLYYYNGASTATPDGVTVIQPSVGSGRWLLLKSSTLPAPTVSTLGGLFSHAASAHQFITSVNTDGTTTQAQPAASDISGLGTMATQNSSAVAITGGNIDGTTIGATTPTGATFLNSTTNVTQTVGDGTSTRQAKLFMNGGTISGNGSAIYFQRGGATQGFIGTDSLINPGASNDIDVGGGTGQNLKFYANGLLRGTVDSNGLEGMVIGQNTPAQGFFTALSGSVTATGASTSRTLADQFGDVTNVRNFGADPTGAVDCSTAFNNAVAALPANRSCLYIPPGLYNWTSASTFLISGKTNLTIFAPGAVFYDGNNAAARTFMRIDKTCSYVTVIGLHLSGNAAGRVAGAHQFVVDASNAIYTGCKFDNGSQFTFYIGADSTFVTSNVVVTNCTIDNTWADGFHIFNVKDVVVANCVITRTGDDGIGIISDNGTQHGSFITVANNVLESTGGNHAVTTGNGINIQEATDVKVIGNSINNVELVPIYVTRFLSTSFTNARYTIERNNIQNGGLFGAGPYAMIDLHFLTDSDVSGNTIKNIPSGMNGIAFVNVTKLTIDQNHTIGGSRGVMCNDVGSSYTVSGGYTSTWDQVVIKDNVIAGAVNGSIYLNPQLVSATQYSLTNLAVTGNVEENSSTTNPLLLVTNSSGSVAENHSNNSKAISLGANTSNLYVLGEVLESIGSAATLPGSLSGDVVFSAAGAPTLTLPAGTWDLSGGVTSRTSDVADAIWASFYNNTDAVAFGGSPTFQEPSTAGRWAIPINGRIVVPAGTSKLIYIKTFRSGASTLDVGSPATGSHCGYMKAVRIN